VDQAQGWLWLGISNSTGVAGSWAGIIVRYAKPIWLPVCAERYNISAERDGRESHMGSTTGTALSLVEEVMTAPRRLYRICQSR
jgi:hypothetical protein